MTGDRDPGRRRAGDGAAAGQEEQHHPPALGRREGAHGHCAGVCDLPCSTPRPSACWTRWTRRWTTPTPSATANLVHRNEPEGRRSSSSSATNKIAMEMAAAADWRDDAGAGCQRASWRWTWKRRVTRWRKPRRWSWASASCAGPGGRWPCCAMRFDGVCYDAMQMEPAARLMSLHQRGLVLAAVRRAGGAARRPLVERAPLRCRRK